MDSFLETAFLKLLKLSNCLALCLNVPHRDGLVKCSDEVIYTHNVSILPDEKMC